VVPFCPAADTSGGQKLASGRVLLERERLAALD
jgi:hypothetical protein